MIQKIYKLELWWPHNADTLEIPGDFNSFYHSTISRINQPGQDDSNNEHADALDTVPLEAVSPEGFHPINESLETAGPRLRHV